MTNTYLSIQKLESPRKCSKVALTLYYLCSPSGLNYYQASRLGITDTLHVQVRYIRTLWIINIRSTEGFALNHSHYGRWLKTYQVTPKQEYLDKAYKRLLLNGFAPASNNFIEVKNAS